MSRNWKVIKQKQNKNVKTQIQNNILEYSNFLKTEIAKTMSWIGDYYRLSSEIITNDGATIIKDFYDREIFENDIEKYFLKKIVTATERTDQVAGDGTSSTIIIIDALLKEVFKHPILSKFHFIKKQKILDEFEKQFLQKLKQHIKPLNKEKDFIKLATISTKDKNLGKMVGQAFYQAGENATVEAAYSNKTKDYFEIFDQYNLNTSIKLHNFPQEAKNVKVLIIDGEIDPNSHYIDQLIKYTYKTKTNLLILCNGFNEILLQKINTANSKFSENKYFINITNIPRSQNPHFQKEEYILDIATYVGIPKEEILNSVRIKSFNFKEKHLGEIQKYVFKDKLGLFLNCKKENKNNINKRINKLNEKLIILKKEYEKNIFKINALKFRIGSLKGKNVKLYLHAQNPSAFETKNLKIEDALKSTRSTLDLGFVPGAGIIYKKIIPEIKFSNIKNTKLFLNVAHAISNLIEEKARKINITPNRSNISSNDGWIIEEKENELTASVKDVLEAGIIDSAQVIRSVIKNAVAIVKEVISLNGFVYEKTNKKD